MKYRKCTLVLAFLLLAMLAGYAQAPPLFSWQRSLGGSSLDAIQKMLVCANGDQLLTGNTQSANGDIQSNHGARDFWLVRLTSAGQLLWSRTYGGSGSDIATAALELADGSLMVCGYTASVNGDVSGNHGNYDGWVIHLDAGGNLLWQRCYGGSNNDFLEAIVPVTGGFLLGGSTYSTNGNVTGNHGDQDFWIVRIDTAGSIVWQKCVGGSNFEQCFALLALSDGSCVAAGVSASNDGNVSGNHGSNDCMVARLDVNGNLLWARLYGGSSVEAAFACISNTAGNLILTGYSNSGDGDVPYNRGSSDIWFIELNTSGGLLNSKTFGGSNSDIGYAVRENAAGYLLAASTFSTDGDIISSHGGEDVFLVQSDFDGFLQWGKSYGGSANDHGAALVGDYSNGFYVTGYSYSNNGDVSGNHGSSDGWICRLSCLAPQPSFTASDDSVCVNTLVSFTNTSTQTSQYRWDIGGQPYGSSATTSYLFSSAGSIPVDLVAQTCLASDTFLLPVLVSPPPSPVISASSTLLCNNDSILLTTGNADFYHWSTGATTPSVWVHAAGNYTVTAFNGGCAGMSPAVSISARTMPVFSLGHDTAFCSGSNFWITAPAGYSSYAWQDGSPYRSFIATGPGTYTVTVSDGICSFTDSIVLDTINCNLPVARFAGSKRSICQNEAVDFTDLSLNATSWQWSFPGATPSSSTQQHPTGIVYATPGQYDVNLIVSNSTGSNAFFSQNYITVNETPTQPVITATGTILISSTCNAYQWVLDSLPVIGAVSQTFVATQTGNYSVMAISPAGCTSLSDPMPVIVAGLTGAVVPENVLRLYPNPTTGTLSIELDNDQTGTYAIDILDIAGKIVYTGSVISNRPQPELLDVNRLPAGFYTMHLHNAAEHFVARFQRIR
jgi:PKD repeat protein